MPAPSLLLPFVSPELCGIYRDASARAFEARLTFDMKEMPRHGAGVAEYFKRIGWLRRLLGPLGWTAYREGVLSPDKTTVIYTLNGRPTNGKLLVGKKRKDTGWIRVAKQNEDAVAKQLGLFASSPVCVVETPKFGALLVVDHFAGGKLGLVLAIPTEVQQASDGTVFDCHEIIDIDALPFVVPSAAPGLESGPEIDFDVTDLLDEGDEDADDGDGPA